MSFSVGQALPVLEIASVSVEKMKVMALLLDDPNPIHFDPQAVQSLGLGNRPINQGPNSLAYVINMLMAAGGEGARITRTSVRFMANVFAGDRLHAGGTVTRIDGNTITCDVWLKRGDDVIVQGNATIALPPEAT